MNYYKVLDNIKAKYPTAEDTFSFFKLHSSRKELGIVSIDIRAGKFDLRGENTPSVASYPELKFIDFGDCHGEGRTCVSTLIMENTNCSFNEAVKLLALWEKEDISELEQRSLEHRAVAIEEKKVPPYKTFYIEQRIEERNLIQNKEIFNELLKGLFRGCSREQKIAGIKAFNIGLTSYEEINDNDEKVMTHRLFIPEYNEEGIAFGCYKYNRAIKGRKGLLRKNAKRVLFGSHLLKFFKKEVPIILSEGHSDVVVNVSKYLQCITNGSSTKSIKEWLPLLKGRTLHIFPDADYAGIKGATMRSLEIEEFNRKQKEEDKINYKIFLWSEVFIEESIQDFKKFCMPLSALKTNASLKKYSKSWWKDLFTDETLSPFINKEIMIKAQAISLERQQRLQKAKIRITPNMLLENWTILSKDPLKQGFDFIDFHEKNRHNKNYTNFLSKYKFK